ncbi:MAG: hypothetical protein J6V25_09995 [Oscillospiraceae bacterium]|nr:hypothetical protein [Oscillospiraceae bacterium]
MSELEEKLGNLLSDPNMMQQIMGMAKMLSSSSPPQEPLQEAAASAAPPQLDPNMLQALSGLARQGGIDPHQNTLLQALQPYLSQNRISKLQRAMGAARMASAASAFINAGGGKLPGLR